MADVVDFEARRAAPTLMEQIEGFLRDPPDTDFQCGFLAALLAVYKETMGKGGGDARIIAAEGLLRRAIPQGA